MKYSIDETSWCFLKQRVLQAGEETTLAFCKTASEQNDSTVLYETTVLCALDVITFNGKSTQFTEIHLDGAVLRTSWQCTRILHIITGQSNKVDSW